MARGAASYNFVLRSRQGRLVEMYSDEFDMTSKNDSYMVNLKKTLKAKQAGAPALTFEIEKEEVVAGDLMSQLNASLAKAPTAKVIKTANKAKAKAARKGKAA